MYCPLFKRSVIEGLLSEFSSAAQICRRYNISCGWVPVFLEKAIFKRQGGGKYVANGCAKTVGTAGSLTIIYRKPPSREEEFRGNKSA